MLSKDILNLHYVDEYINECPYCDKGIKAEILAFNTVDCDSTTYVNVMAKCPICSEIFFGKYNYDNLINHLHYFTSISPATIYPSKNIKSKFNESLEQMSSEFVKQYNQAELVEQMGMLDVSGLAYRRAFEYLIKDFAVMLFPDKKDEIIKDNKLSNIFENRLPDKYGLTEIKNIARRAWWLGNDYAHYTKHYIDKDISDLKECIEITQNYITLYIKYNLQVDTIKKNS